MLNRIAESGDDSDDEDDVQIGGVTQDYKCPLTLTIFVDPLTSCVYTTFHYFYCSWICLLPYILPENCAVIHILLPPSRSTSTTRGTCRENVQRLAVKSRSPWVS